MENNNSKANTKLNKLARVRKFLEEKGAEGIIVSTWQNVLYLSGFTGYGDGVLLVTADKAFIVTDSRYYVQAAEQAPEFELVKGNCASAELMKKLLADNEISKVVYENEGILYKEYCGYYKALGAELLEAGGLFDNMRLIKTEDEIAAIKAACDLASKALEMTKPEIAVGATEIEVAAKLEYNMRILGAEKPSFETIVASGYRGAMPHGTARMKKIEDGDLVTIDFGAFYGGVCSDMTRTFFVGEPAKELCKIYDIVKAAHDNAISGYKSGMTGSDIDKIARDYIKDAGYGDFFGHGLGHGVGINVHEAPAISPRGTTVLEQGMVFSIEPGIYIPELGGVRIEDLVTIRDGSLEVLTV